MRWFSDPQLGEFTVGTRSSLVDCSSMELILLTLYQSLVVSAVSLLESLLAPVHVTLIFPTKQTICNLSVHISQTGSP